MQYSQCLKGKIVSLNKLKIHLKYKIFNCFMAHSNAVLNILYHWLLLGKYTFCSGTRGFLKCYSNNVFMMNFGATKPFAKAEMIKERAEKLKNISFA